MCTTCGCGAGEVRIEDGAHGHRHTHAEGSSHSHGQARLLQVERDILSKNDGLAQRNRHWLAERGIFALNLVSSPGSGKTTLLVRTIQMLHGRLPITVVEGDQQTSVDADRIRATGAPAIQINTGKGCHLDAEMIGTALQRVAPEPDSVLMIENVGNLVCPALFDLGERAKVAILSVTEGEDKPLKYPHMFRAAEVMVINKIDLLPYVDFDVRRAIANAKSINPAITALQVSARSGEGLPTWYEWIRSHRPAAQPGAR
jgi:hydrogenase nickel incorporation protein HypB